jgi:hypothetical protein
MLEPKKSKPPKQTLEDLLKTNQVTTGKAIIEKKKVMDEAIEFERRQRDHKSRQ